MDFDDTLSTGNVAQMLLMRYAPEEFSSCSARYRADEISFREYQEQSFDAVPVSITEMQQTAANETEIRAGIEELLRVVDETNATLTVLSAGLDIYIRPVLERFGLSSVDLICGSATREPSRDGQFRYDYPFGSTESNGCKGDWATCKCKALEQVSGGTTTVFVGDGSTSDACAAEKADHVFARDRLLRICKEKRIPATPFEDFIPVTELLGRQVLPEEA